MDKKTLDDMKKHIKELNRREGDPHHIIAREIFENLTKFTKPLDWSASAEDEQPVILIPLKIPKAFTGFLDTFEKHMKKEGSREKILQALGDVIVITGLSEGALRGVNLSHEDIENFMEMIKKEMGE